MAKFKRFIAETRMPSGVIEQKQKFANMSDQDLAKHFKMLHAGSAFIRPNEDKGIEHLARRVAWRHGHGKMSGHYWERIKNHLGEAFDAAKANKEHADKLKKMAYEGAKKAQLKEDFTKAYQPGQKVQIHHNTTVPGSPNLMPHPRRGHRGTIVQSDRNSVAVQFGDGKVEHHQHADVIHEEINRPKDPPMMLILRRQAIRNYPNNERVALYSNPQLKIQLAVPYDYTSGTLKASNMLPIKEDELDEAFNKDGVDVKKLNAYKKREMKKFKAGQKRFGDELRRVAKETGRGPLTGRKLKEESHDEHHEQETKEGMIATLASAYEDLQNDSSSELDSALFNWLTDEVAEHGDFAEMSDDVLNDVYDDYMGLITGAADAEEDLDERARHERKVNDYADWHELANRKGDASFKIHNAGNTTSAFRNGKHIGSFHHDKRAGALHEESLDESPVMRINNIMKRGEEGSVDHHNGGSSKVHPKTANVINGLLSRVNQGNREKLGHLINASPEGLRRVVAFANELVGQKAK